LTLFIKVGEKQMRNDIRDSGIDIIGNMPGGTHFGQFYQTKADLMDILIPYLKSGLENGQIELISYADWYLKNNVFDSYRA
jgi:hypothetical protein